MADVPTTNLTVAKLKALCVLNDLSASGKKADLLARLLEAGVDKETLGVEVFDEATATFHAAPVDGEEPAPEEGASGESDHAPGEESEEDGEMEGDERKKVLKSNDGSRVNSPMKSVPSTPNANGLASLISCCTVIATVELN